MSLSECGSTFVPITSPKDVLAAEALVAPVPPSDMARVPVIELASSFKANSVDSKTIPPLALRSAAKLLPFLDKPSPAEICPAPENCAKTRLFVPTTADPVSEVQVNPFSALTVPCSTKTKAPAALAPVGKSSVLVHVLALQTYSPF